MNPDKCLTCGADKIMSLSSEGYTAYIVNRRRVENLELALRLKKFLVDNGIDTNFAQKEPLDALVHLSIHMVDSPNANSGENILKAISNIGEVRLDPSVARAFCELGRLKQLNVLLDHAQESPGKSNEIFFRLGKDMGMYCTPTS